MGYEAATFQEIAARADLTRPAINHYYPSKEALYRHVVAETNGSVIAAGLKEAEAEQNEQIADLQQQQQYAPPAAPAAAPAAPAESREDAIAQLKDLKGLLDSGVLTQAEFDAQKTKILGEMS